MDLQSACKNGPDASESGSKATCVCCALQPDTLLLFAVSEEQPVDGQGLQAALDVLR